MRGAGSRARLATRSYSWSIERTVREQLGALSGRLLFALQFLDPLFGGMQCVNQVGIGQEPCVSLQRVQIAHDGRLQWLRELTAGCNDAAVLSQQRSRVSAELSERVEAGLEYLRKFRDVKYHEAIFEVLARQFEAAKIDGAKPWAVFRYIQLPKMKRVLTIAILLRFMDSFMIYTEISVLTGGRPSVGITRVS